MPSETNISVLTHILFYRAFSWYIDGLVQERESEIFMNDPLQYTKWLVKIKKYSFQLYVEYMFHWKLYYEFFLGQRHNKTLFYQGAVKIISVKSLFKLQFLCKIHSVTFEISNKISMG